MDLDLIKTLVKEAARKNRSQKADRQKDAKAGAKDADKKHINWYGGNDSWYGKKELGEGRFSVAKFRDVSSARSVMNGVSRDAELAKQWARALINRGENKEDAYKQAAERYGVSVSFVRSVTEELTEVKDVRTMSTAVLKQAYARFQNHRFYRDNGPQYIEIVAELSRRGALNEAKLDATKELMKYDSKADDEKMSREDAAKVTRSAKEDDSHVSYDEFVSKAVDKFNVNNKSVLIRKKELEDLHEISRKKLGNYVNAAAANYGKQISDMAGSRYDYDDPDERQKAREKIARKAKNRLVGVAKATGRLTREENLDESRISVGMSVKFFHNGAEGRVIRKEGKTNTGQDIFIVKMDRDGRERKATNSDIVHRDKKSVIPHIYKEDMGRRQVATTFKKDGKMKTNVVDVEYKRRKSGKKKIDWKALLAKADARPWRTAMATEEIQEDFKRGK